MKIFAVIVILGAGLGTAFGQSSTRAPEPLRSAAISIPIDAKSGSRLPLLTRADMQDEASARIYDTVAGPGGDPPRGTLAIALYSPPTAAALHRIETYLWTESDVERPLLSLASLIAAREMNLPHAWSEYSRTASQAGLAPAAIEAVRLNRPTAGLSAIDALIIDFGRQLFRNRHVDSRTFAALAQQQGRQRTFDIIMALTYPTMAGLLQRAVDQQPPANWNPDTLPVIPGVGTPIGQPGDFIELGPRPPLPADVHEDSYYRFPLLKRDELDTRGRELFDRLVGKDRDTTPRGPVGMTFNSPEFAEPIQNLNTALRMEGLLDRRIAEIVVAATGREMNSQYQWIVHGAAAEQAGAEQHVLDSMRTDGDLDHLDERDAVAIAFTRDLFRHDAVRPPTFDSAMRLFGARGTVELAALVGDYLMMTTVYNALGMRLREDQTPTLPHRAGAPVGAEWR